MLTVTAAESATTYLFTVRDDETRFTFLYEFQKHQEKTHKRIMSEDQQSWNYHEAELEDNPQSKADYIQQCKREALLLAQDEIDRLKQPKPMSI